MKKNIKTSVLCGAFAILRDAKLSKCEDADKFKVIKLLRKLKGICTEFEDFQKDAMERLKGDNHDEMVELAQEWQKDGENTKLSEEVRKNINEYFGKYNSDVLKCIDEEANKENELEFDGFTDDGFEKLMASNDWTAAQALDLSELLCE